MPVRLPNGDVKYHLFHIYSLSCTFTSYVLFPNVQYTFNETENPPKHQNKRNRTGDDYRQYFREFCSKVELKNGWLIGRALGVKEGFLFFVLLCFLKMESMFVYCWELLSRQENMVDAEERGMNCWSNVLGWASRIGFWCTSGGAGLCQELMEN